jgi:hypothetical protein
MPRTDTAFGIPMNLLRNAHRRLATRAASARRAQAGVAGRGAVVVAGLVAALGLQVAGSRLQCRLADLVGIGAVAPGAAPVMAPASMPSCGSSSGAIPMHPCKVTHATSAGADEA